MINSYIFLSLVTTLYCFLHSFFANTKVKTYFIYRNCIIRNYYRIIYNVFSIITLIPILIFIINKPGKAVWTWPFPLVMDVIFWCTIVLFFATLKFYNLNEFLGTNNLNSKNPDITSFVISPFHRYVRHPWYFLALIALWSRDLTTSSLIVTSIFSLYFLIGSRFEENKLISQYGMKYQLYKEKVPALFPIPFKYLNNETLEIIKKIK